VYTVARRVAFVGEENSSLFRHALSYLLSLFVFRQPVDDDVDAEILVDRLTPFTLLDRANASLERGCLEQAVRYVNQLTGEPRRVATDWLREAILLLETKQAADVLLTYAAAANIKH
jgi:mitofilin